MCFDVNCSHLIALLSKSQKLLSECIECENILKKYKQNNDYSLVSLLDFACRYKSDGDDTNNDYNHGLNISLYQYQLQSLKWMINEENHEIGFYRHLYQKGKFMDNTPFWYSPIFKKLIINEDLPKAHGGLLCEEMGLGKTIISLALISCNKPMDGDNDKYSTKKRLFVSHTDTKTKWDYVWNEEEKKMENMEYKEEYKYYKSKATLIIAPTSLIGQWEKECDEHERKLTKRYYGSRSRDLENILIKI